MKKFLISLMVIAGGFIGIYIAYAESVTTQDGKNFLITNDIGKTATMTYQQILQQETQANSAAVMAAQQDLSASEIAFSWWGVDQLAQQANATYQASLNQEVNATTNSANVTNSSN